MLETKNNYLVWRADYHDNLDEGSAIKVDAEGFRDAAKWGADEYHANHGGNECDWPLKFLVVEKATRVSKIVEVERDVVPEFYVMGRKSVYDLQTKWCECGRLVNIFHIHCPDCDEADQDCRCDKRYFEVDDHGAIVSWTVVARDEKHALAILEADDGYRESLEEGPPTVTEIPADQIKDKTFHDDGEGQKPYSALKMGDWTCSEY